MSKSGRLFSLTFTLLLLALNLISFNILAHGWTGMRADLTEDRLYSITEATQRILQNLDDEVLIRGYFSKRTHPKLSPLVPEIRDLLDEYAAVSKGRVRVELVDPGEDEKAAELAQGRFGVSPTPFRNISKYESGIVNAYFALVVQFGDRFERYDFGDLIAVDAAPDGDFDVRLKNLEYDLTRAIKKVVFGFRSTAELFGQIEAPVRLTAILSPETLPEMFAEVPQGLREAAEELEKDGGPKFEFIEIDPTKDEQLRVQVERMYGARPMEIPFAGTAPFYYYCILEVGEQAELINLFSEGISSVQIREDIEHALRRHAPGFLKTIGVSASMMSLSQQELMQFQMRGQQPPPPQPEFAVLEEYLGLDYETTQVELEQGVPTNVDVLLVLKPKSLSERAVFHLDQYLMRGGRVILCTSKYEIDGLRQLQDMRATPLQSGVEDWLGHLGVQIGDEFVLDDQNARLPIPVLRRTELGMLRTIELVRYPYALAPSDNELLEPTVTGPVSSMGIYWANPITLDAEKTKQLDALKLIRSSARSWTDRSLAGVGSSEEYVVPEEGLGSQTVAVALTGRFQSYFKDREVPAAAPPPTPPGQPEAVETPEGPTEAALEQSPETRLVVVGSGDFLSDVVQQIAGFDGPALVEGNLDFVKNVIDWMNLDNDMISIRSRRAGPRSLRPTESDEVTIELANYAIPFGIILAFGVLRLLTRKNARARFNA